MNSSFTRHFQAFKEPTNAWTVEQKRKLAELVTRYAIEKAGITADDITLLMYAIPLENMSFGRGKLISDIDLAMPWVR
jgi:phenylpyruvate tautomerase PptA (4-oxalocrotonate tautomerase family)